MSMESDTLAGRIMIFGRRGIAFMLTLLILAACAQKQEKKPPPPPMKVGAVKVDKGSIEQILDLSGSLNFIANTTVSSEVSAQVKSIEVQDGQAVEESQLLLVSTRPSQGNRQSSRCQSPEGRSHSHVQQN